MDFLKEHLWKNNAKTQLQNWNSHLCNTREQREGIIASEVKEKRRKDCVTEWLESGVLGKTGTLEKEATSGPKALWQKPEVQEENKRRNQKEEASHSEEYRHGFTYWIGLS